MSPIKITLEEVKRCTDCTSLLPLIAKPILQFSPSSKILLAGQAPGKIAHDKGRPFEDQSGDRLRAWLNIDKATFYDEQVMAIVPMGFCYPGTGKNGDLPPIKHCASKWRNQVMSSFQQLELTVVIGQYAIDWHLKHLRLNAKSSKSVTGSVAKYESLLEYNIIALPHPSPRNNRWLKKNPWFEQEVIPLLQQQVSQILHSSNSNASTSSA